MKPSMDPRFLAPAALGAGFLFLIIAVIASGVFGGGDNAYVPATTTKSAGKDATKTGQNVNSETATQETQIETTTESDTTIDSSGQDTYTVKSGDDLSKIAQETGVTVAELIKLNPEIEPTALSPGQTLNLK